MRLRINSMARAFGLEEDDAPIVVEGENTDAALVESEAEVDQAMDDIDTAQDTVDTLNNDAETVENVTEIVDNSIENGEGLDETSAAIVQETIESIYRRHGMPKRHWPRFPSTESFRSRSDRIRSTRAIKVALEGAWDTIKNAVVRVWETIRDFFVDLYKKFTDFEYRLFDKFKELGKALKEGGGIKLGKKDEKDKGYELGAIKKYRGELADADYTGGDWKERTKGKATDPKEKIPTLTELTTQFSTWNRKGLQPFIAQLNSDKFKKLFNETLSADDENNDARQISESDQDEWNAEIYSLVMVSPFSTNNLSESDQGKDGPCKAIKATYFDEAKAAIDAAIDVLSKKPMKQMEKYSNSFITDIINSIKKFFGSKTDRIEKFDKSASSSDESANKFTGSEINNLLAKGYRNAITGNIKVYKDTISNFYDIVKGTIDHQGYTKTDTEKATANKRYVEEAAAPATQSDEGNNSEQS